MVSPGWYRAIGLRLLRGPPTRSGNRYRPHQVVVVNQKFVDTFLPGEEPLGQQIKQDPDNQTIIGVVSNGRHAIEEPAMAETDYPMSEVPLKDNLDELSMMSLFVRTTVPPEAIVAQLR